MPALPRLRTRLRRQRYAGIELRLQEQCRRVQVGNGEHPLPGNHGRQCRGHAEPEPACRRGREQHPRPTSWFTTDDGNLATGLSITSDLSVLPAGWSSGSGSFSCPSLSTGQGCQLSLIYAPVLADSGTLTLSFSYINDSGNRQGPRPPRSHTRPRHESGHRDLKRSSLGQQRGAVRVLRKTGIDECQHRGERRQYDSERNCRRGLGGRTACLDSDRGMHQGTVHLHR